jgi:hypothetical protein
MYIAKLKDGAKRVKKTFPMILERVFEMECWMGRVFLKLKYFSPVRILTSPLFEETLGAFLFLSLSPFSILFLSFFYAPSLEDLGVLMIFEEKDYFFKNFLFQWLDLEWHGHDCRYTGGGRIFRNGVMHINIAKPWLWRSGSCRYIGSGHIFWSGGMHANISEWG